MSVLNLATVVQACIRNGERLTEDAALLHDFDRHPTAFSMAVLAQEEFAKAFLLVLVQEGVIPWTPEVHRALYSHECKHLTGVMMEWLGPVFEEAIKRCMASGSDAELQSIPHDVAVAINILRHEKIEKLRSRWVDKDPEDNGLSRKIAEGLTDRLKQRALYVGVTDTGWVDSLPIRVTGEMALLEIERAKQYGGFAADAFGGCVLSFREYAFFKEVVAAVFADLARGGPET